MKVNEYLPNLTSKSRFDLMHWNVSIGPDKWLIFGRFLTLFPLKRPVQREKIPPTWRRRPSVTSPAIALLDKPQLNLNESDC
jgi:hypothetical protein